MSKRAMTFGCSFTKYYWPTWADIVLKQAELHGYDTDNWGLPGVGNTYIALKVQEAITKGLIKSGDYVFICWSTIMREDRAVDGKWISPGNIFNQHMYPESFVANFADTEFYAYRDSALINATRCSLNSIGVNQFHTLMHTHEAYHNQLHTDQYEKHKSERIKRIFETFKLQFDAKSIMTVLNVAQGVETEWEQGKRYKDTHHLPKDMLNYVKLEMLNKGIDWLNTVDHSIESWVSDVEDQITNTPKPLRPSSTFNLSVSKYPHYGAGE